MADDRTVDLSEVSLLSLGFRKEHYRKSFGAYAEPVQSPSRRAICEIADDEARDEMLQEIHTMLLHLCGKLTKDHTNG